MLIGLLALQGDYNAHAHVLRSLGAQTRLVRSPRDLDGLGGLVIPGGESTVMGRLCDRYGLRAPFDERVRNGFPFFGTCAGLIFLATHLEGTSQNVAQSGLGALDATVARNAYGAQLDSFEADIDVPILGASIRGVFIRAPQIRALGPKVETLAHHQGVPVLVRQGATVASSFHPEIAGESRLHALWLHGISERQTTSEGANDARTPNTLNTPELEKTPNAEGLGR